MPGVALGCSRRCRRLAAQSCPSSLDQLATGRSSAGRGPSRAPRRSPSSSASGSSGRRSRRAAAGRSRARAATAISLSRSNGGSPGQALVEHAAERVDVGAAVDRLALDLLRREVVDGAEERPAAGEARDRRGVLGESEVAEIRVLAPPARPRVEDVRRLDVAMDEPARVRGVERRRDLADERRRARSGSSRPALSSSAAQVAPST